MTGFTLVEVLVALTIFGAAFATIEVGLHVSSIMETRAAQKEEAIILAESLLNATGSSLPRKIGGTSGETVGGLKWHVSVTPWGNAEDQQARLASGYWIEVTVKNDDMAVTLSTLQAGPVLNEGQ